ncbi:hepatic and glial cell adhesion molecule-like [Sardina pilchardus]|uniref:hepatic and glial cell adhesion molecule-like n=1 Tax=Sardina pilchardus TaxID=27697 RepID=UPI002E155F61
MAHTVFPLQVFMLMTVGQLKGNSGLDSICDVTQDAECYGALGGPVYLQLMRNAREYALGLFYGSSCVFRDRRSKSVFYNEFNTTSVLQRWQFVPDNGTMIINPAERRDTGTYRVQITEESTGKSVGIHTVQLTIEAPVSYVNLSISCSANGERRVMCSSNGDSPQYSWSLDGRPLDDAAADLSSDNQTLLLRGDVTGQLTCSVRNHVSSTHTTRLMELCSGASTTVSATPANHTLPSAPTQFPGSGLPPHIVYILGGVACALVLVVVVTAVIVCKKRRVQLQDHVNMSVQQGSVPKGPDDVGEKNDKEAEEMDDNDYENVEEENDYQNVDHYGTEEDIDYENVDHYGAEENIDYENEEDIDYENVTVCFDP